MSLTGHWLCQYNFDDGACHYGIGIGVLGFLGCVGFLVVDAMFESVTSVKTRKHIVLADMAFSGIQKQWNTKIITFQATPISIYSKSLVI